MKTTNQIVREAPEETIGGMGMKISTTRPRRLVAIAAAALASAVSAPAAGSTKEAPGEWSVRGPSSGGFLQTVAAPPSGEGVVLASIGPTSPTWPTGVHRSLDGGESWEPAASGLPDRFYPQTIAFDPADPAVAYAAGDGVYRTMDSAATWFPASQGLPSGYVNSLAVDPAGWRTVYAANAGGISRSEDLGRTWQTSNSGLPEFMGARALASSAAAPDALYVAVLRKSITPGWAIYRSTDRGASWQVTSLAQAEFIYTQTAAPSDASTVYVGHAQGVRVTRNAGATWSDASNGLPEAPVRNLLVFPGSTSRVLAATDQGLFATADGGGTWSEVQGGFPVSTRSDSLALAAGESPTIYATSNQRGGVFRSSDWGESWTPGADGFPADLWMRGVATAFSRPGTAYSGTYSGGPQGVYRTTSAGRGWKGAGGGGLPSSISGLAVSPTDADVVFAAAYSNGLYKTADGGKSWSKLNTPTAQLESVVVAPSNPQIVYAGGVVSDLGSGVPPIVLRSTDGGESWTSSSLGFPRYPCVVLDLAVDPTNPNTVYSATGFCGMFKSIDGGQTWLSTNVGIVNYVVVDVTVDRSNASTVYAAVVNPADTGGVFKSTVGGLVWTPALVGDNATAVEVDPTNPQKVYAALATDPKKVARSADGGASWTGMNDGFDSDVTPVKLAIDSDGKRLYVSSTRGVYVTTPP